VPYVYVYQCTRCDFDMEIVLGKEFRVEPDGSRADYEYPAPDLYEWPPTRVSGLWNRLWCPACRAVRPCVLVELPEPAEHPVQAYLAAEARGMTGAETGPCPTCGTELLVDAEDQPCPACDVGRLRAIGEYEP
jgi:hypothetical protein